MPEYASPGVQPTGYQKTSKLRARIQFISRHILFAKSRLRTHYLNVRQPDDEFIPTRATLIDRLKNWQDQASWQDFFDTYWKLIYGVARKSSLTETEAQEVVQAAYLSQRERRWVDLPLPVDAPFVVPEYR